jgi:molybdate transport system substrate-binding protein
MVQRMFSLVMVSAFVVFAPPLDARAQGALGGEINVAAAEETNPALAEIARSFEAKTGIHVRLKFGNSEAFYSEIRGGGAFDVFFSADINHPRRLISSGVGLSLTQYARDGLALCISPMSPFPVSPRNPLAVLRDKVVSHIAVADARKTSIGRATVQALRKASVYDLTVRRKLIVGDSVAETAQFVEQGQADVALLPTSAIRTNSLANFRVIKLSPSLYQPIIMGAVVMKPTRNRKEAIAFVNFAASPIARAIFRRYGFSAY